ncbi:MAG: pentapeptide repeat-containing protein [Acidobacteriota bacterium]
MANPEHLAKLKEGVEAWNEWRAENPHVVPDLGGAEVLVGKLSQANLSAADLSEAMLFQADLREARLMNADLSRARMQRANLGGAILHGADLTGSDLFMANLSNADIRNSDLSEAHLNKAILTNVDLSRIRGLVLDDNPIEGAKFPPRASDPWSILRRNYTGPRLLFHLLLLVAFVGPYALEAATWLTLSSAQLKAPHLVEAAAGPQAGPIDTWNQTTVGSLLLDRHRGPWALALAVVLLVYNILRGILTASVGPLREEEERTNHTPVLGGWNPWGGGYRWLIPLHRVLQVLLVVALASFVFHAWHWFTAPVWLPPG